MDLRFKDLWVYSLRCVYEMRETHLLSSWNAAVKEAEDYDCERGDEAKGK